MKTKLATFILLVCLGLITSSCTEVKQAPGPGVTEQDSSGGAGTGSGKDSFSGGGSDLDDDEIITFAKVEIRSLIEPKIDDASSGGDYKRKLTLPKNYSGLLYLQGLNISTLSSKNIKVRFNLGYYSSPIEIPAYVSSAPGLTPQTDVQVLIMDLRHKPFDSVNLDYDLFDYNTYDFAGTSGNAALKTEPVSFNRDDKLYCRGLKLKDDPTFTGRIADGCINSDDVCKYSSVTVVDQGLIQKTTNTDPDHPIVPSEVNAQSSGLSYYTDSDETKLQRCLPDDPSLYGSNTYAFSGTESFSTAFANFYTSFLTIGALGDYYYRGPYRANHATEWEISGDALLGKYGIFKDLYNNNVEFGYGSKLFPLYAKRELLKDTQYLGSATPNAEKSLLSMASNDESQWMDGCNKRVSTVDEVTGEHIGSCNVSATIEIIEIDAEGNDIVIDSTTEVKIQLVKPVDLNTSGVNILLSSFQQCSSSSQCGSDSCCVNKRCWSKSIVSQCVEDLPNFGNATPGETCSSDHECASLCCNESSGKCAPHDTNRDEPVLCSKSSGQKCIAKEWCQQHPITHCAIINSGTDALGGTTCDLRCVVVEDFGECKPQNSEGTSFGTCIPPEQPTHPVFNPLDPNRCEDAISFNDFLASINKK